MGLQVLHGVQDKLIEEVGAGPMQRQGGGPPSLAGHDHDPGDRAGDGDRWRRTAQPQGNRGRPRHGYSGPPVIDPGHREG